MQHLNLWAYDIALKQPLKFHSRRHQTVLTQRQGLLLEWIGGKHTYWSELAPLPLFSSETLGEAEQVLKTFFRNQMFRNFQELERSHQAQADQLPPSINCALEAGLYQLLHPINGVNQDFIPQICGLNTADNTVAEQGLTSHLANAQQSIKQKISGEDSQQDLQMLKKVLGELAPNQVLRIDANQSWDLPQAINILKQLPCSKIEYVEEPLQQMTQAGCAELFQKTHVSIALDESLRQNRHGWLALLSHEPQQLNKMGINTLVIKPMLTGWYKTISLLDICRLHHFNAVLSSAIESSLSLNLYWKLAQHYQLTCAQGLDTGKYLQQDLLEPLIFRDHLIHESPLLSENDKVLPMSALQFKGQLM